MTSRLYVYFDLESTGLSRWHDKITQIGATAIQKTKETEYIIISSFETLVKADKRINPVASEKTGIYNVHLTEAPPISDALNLFFDWLKKLQKKYDNSSVSLIAYNGNNFDFPLLFSEMYRSSILTTELLKSCGIDFLVDPFLWAKKEIDVTCLTRRANGSCCLSLSSVYSALMGKKMENAHQALADTEGLKTICCHSKFEGMNSQTVSYYCLDVIVYMQTFVIKRKSIDSVKLSSKKETKNRYIFPPQPKTVHNKGKRKLEVNPELANKSQKTVCDAEEV